MTVPSRISGFAPAKINLYLHVGDKRADGYHELESLVTFAEVADTLVFEPADTLSLEVTGPFGAALTAEGDNLILRAARALALQERCDRGAKITLTKNLPVASGIGGGSADAAATLRGLVRLWDIEIGAYGLGGIAEALGSDVPVCLESRTSWMEGRGEIVTRSKAIPHARLVLVNPGVAVPTAAVFRGLKTRTGVGMREGRIPWDPDAWSVAEYLRSTTNDLEAPALEIAPVIGDVLAALRAQPGVLLARMSGSGATCFALFDGEASGPLAAEAIAQAHPEWWVQSTRVLV
ncbi:MAG: 4-(cytidine 5'-diphospho)-2-C-methyl-D-erythritol kinase [Rhizomicrobium sp.]